MTTEEMLYCIEWLRKWITVADPNVKNVADKVEGLLAAYEDACKEVQRLKWRLNHQTDDDVAACRRGLHGDDCGK